MGKQSTNLDETTKLLFQCAVRGLYDPVIKLLASNDLPTESIDEAFLRAAEHGQLKMVCLLSKKISNVHCTNSKGYDASLIAAKHGHIDILHALLKLNANVNYLSPRLKTTPLHICVANKQSETFSFLIEHKADINICDGKKIHHYIQHVLMVVLI